MKKIGYIVILLFVSFATGCASIGSSSETSHIDLPGVPAQPASAPSEGERAALDIVNVSDQAVENATIQSGDRMVIKNAELNIVVDDPIKAMDVISKIPDQLGGGGFVVDSRLYKTTTNNGIEVPEGSITIRIPAEKLTESLSQIKALVQDPKTDVQNENIAAQDITKEYTDLNSRLANLEKTEQKLQQFLDSARTTEDALNVLNQLSSVGEQIDVLKGQIKYYDDAARLSSISVKVLAKESVQPLTIGGWHPDGVAREAIQALIDALKFLVNFGIWLIIFILPVGILIFLPIWLIIRGIRSLRRKSKAKLVEQILHANNTEEGKK